MIGVDGGQHGRPATLTVVKLKLGRQCILIRIIHFEGLILFKRILLPHDGSAMSKKAVKQGVALAKVCNASVVGFYAPEEYQIVLYSEYVPPNLLTKSEFEAYAKKRATRYLDYIRKQADEADVPCEIFYTHSASPWDAIVNAAKKKKCDLIIMASHGRHGIASLIIGSQTQKVLAHTKIPVMVCR